jgi:hypothetical protein
MLPADQNQLRKNFRVGYHPVFRDAPPGIRIRLPVCFCGSRLAAFHQLHSLRQSREARFRRDRSLYFLIASTQPNCRLLYTENAEKDRNTEPFIPYKKGAWGCINKGCVVFSVVRFFSAVLCTAFHRPEQILPIYE